MLTRYLQLALILVLLPAEPSCGQEALAVPRDPQIVEKLGYVVTAASMITSTNAHVDAVMNAARGGNNSGTPLGCYHIGCQPGRKFASDYIAENAGTMVNWAYDLHSFLTKDHQYDLDYLPEYRIVRAFADQWWKQGSQVFGRRPSMHRSAWIYEAILDGIQIWANYEALDGIASTDTIAYFDVALARYSNASPAEIFF